MAEQPVPEDVQRGRELIDWYTKRKGRAKGTTDALIEGYYARLLGSARTDNPYSDRPKLHSAWDQGWESGGDERADSDRRRIHAATAQNRGKVVS